MKILLIGPPGSGKGTQSRFIINRYNLLYVSFGDILRNISYTQSKFGLKIKNILDSGKLIDDLLALEIIKNFLFDNLKKYKNGFLIDGFPRNVEQANLIKNINIKINIIFQFSIKNSILIERLSGRLIHKKSGRIYHDLFNPPINAGLDDITGELLNRREDDNLDSINNRLNIYYSNLNELKKFFIDKYNENINYNIIDANLNSNLLKEFIFKILDNWILLNKK